MLDLSLLSISLATALIVNTTLFILRERSNRRELDGMMNEIGRLGGELVVEKAKNSELNKRIIYSEAGKNLR